MGARRIVVWCVLALAACATPDAPSRDWQSSRPAGVVAGPALPPKGPDGRFITANTGLGPRETMFHFRAALNVAALVCVNAAARPGYNIFLKRHNAVLAAANREVEASYRREFGDKGPRVRDRRLTSLYNQFAFPPVQTKFCAKTARHLIAANALAPRNLESYAQSALAEIEQDFQDYFREIEARQARQRARLAAGR